MRLLQTTEPPLFDRYQITKMVAAGGQCIGYQATDLTVPVHQYWKRNVFLKQYHDIFPHTPEANALFFHFKTLNDRLGDNINIVTLPLFIGQTERDVIAIYPWVQGQTLRDHMNDGIDQQLAIRIAFALTKSVRIMHTKRIAHLDLKPSNVVIDQNKRDSKFYIHLIDLDAAQIDGVGLRDNVIGTPGYMSPEHYDSELFGSASVKSDVFTLGIMLYELLFKKHPFHDVDDFKETTMKGIYDVPGKFRYHYEIVEKVLECLMVDPSKRPPAGKVLSTLMLHFDTNLEVTRLLDLWHPSRLIPTYLQIDHESIDFRRVFYESTPLNRQAFRGSRIESLAESPVRFEYDASNARWTLHVLRSDITVQVNHRSPRPGEKIRLYSLQNIQIEDAKFKVSCVRYERG
jgi:serine/threonine protein kinase